MMAQSRNFSYTMPVPLVEQITKRADLSGKTRNQEMRHLLSIGLEMAGMNEFVVELPEGPPSRGVVYIDHDMLSEITARAKKFHRHTSWEIGLLIAHAIQEITNRDLAQLKAMMSRVDQAAS